MVGPCADRTGYSVPLVVIGLPEGNSCTWLVWVKSSPGTIVRRGIADAMRMNAVREAVVCIIIAEMNEDGVTNLGTDDGSRKG